MPAPLDLTGKRFGKLTAMKVGLPKGRMRRWICRCDCGGMTLTQTGNLQSGHTTSCGCAKFEPNEKAKIHGQTGTQTHAIWKAMRQRCTNPSNRAYPRYGGRGIKVCERWSSFENFLDDMGEKPDGHTLDRIDNNGDYTPENCRWASTVVQNRNKRNNRMLTHDGKTLCLTDWAELTGVSVATIWARLKLGWSVKRALTTAVAK